MKDLFSLEGKQKDHAVRYFKKKMYQWIEEEDRINVRIKRWYGTMSISCLICDDLITLIIVKKKAGLLYEKYTVL
ncbi:hypothetical protein ACP3T3_03285 [Chryseobacterium sp. CBSDS_008]|uniref:hypothetical protein n=1 Tax=Chryseobacterium sp. CBSDS_008 TaxID=3415265 RepID=UPI003CF55A5A